MIVHTYNPSTREAEQENSREDEVSLSDRSKYLAVRVRGREKEVI